VENIGRRDGLALLAAIVVVSALVLVAAGAWLVRCLPG
jgi:hypothetical protein